MSRALSQCFQLLIYAVLFYIYWHFFHNSCFKKTRMAYVLVTPLAIPIQRAAISGISRAEENDEEAFLLLLLHQPQALLNTNTPFISHQGGCSAATKPREVTRLTAWSRLPHEIVQAFQGEIVPRLCTSARFMMLIHLLYVQPTHTENTHIQAYMHIHTPVHTDMHAHIYTQK